MSFTPAFEKIAGDGWCSLGGIISRLPKGPFKVGDEVIYNPRIKWTNEPDGKHTGGGWEGSDWQEDGVAMGERGVVTETPKTKRYGRYSVKWDRHQYDEKKKSWTHSYDEDELRKLPPLPAKEKV